MAGKGGWDKALEGEFIERSMKYVRLSVPFLFIDFSGFSLALVFRRRLHDRCEHSSLQRRIAFSNSTFFFLFSWRFQTISHFCRYFSLFRFFLQPWACNSFGLMPVLFLILSVFCRWRIPGTEVQEEKIILLISWQISIDNFTVVSMVAFVGVSLIFFCFAHRVLFDLSSLRRAFRNEMNYSSKKVTGWQRASKFMPSPAMLHVPFALFPLHDYMFFSSSNYIFPRAARQKIIKLNPPSKNRQKWKEKSKKT